MERMSALGENVADGHRREGHSVVEVTMTDIDHNDGGHHLAVVLHGSEGVIVFDVARGIGNEPYVIVTSMDANGIYVDPQVAGPVCGSVTLTLPAG
jgi:hypothetical protein